VRKIGGREPDLVQATWRVRLQPEALAPVLRVRGGRFFSCESPAATGAAGGPRPRGDGPVLAAPGRDGPPWSPACLSWPRGRKGQPRQSANPLC